MDFFVGTFNLPVIYTLRLDLERGTLRVLRTSDAVGAHSWLALSHDRSNLYATAWTKPPSVAAYRVDVASGDGTSGHSPGVTLLNTAPVASLSGYVAVSRTHLYSAGGPSGEVFALDARTGAIGAPVQTLSFIDADADVAAAGADGAPAADKHGAFGGLRHGAHSVDLSPDGRLAYVADIGRNCVWSFGIARAGEAGVRASAGTGEGALVRRRRHPAPRTGDGPRHAWPHPSGRVVYVVQEHSSVVDAYAVSYEGDDEATGGKGGGESGAAVLTWMSGVHIIPAGEDAARYWADEVRLSTAAPGAYAHAHVHGQADGAAAPRWLYASTRGLARETRGWIAVVELDAAGGFVGGEARCLYRTRTSGGIANAVQPAPQGGVGGPGAGAGMGRWVDVLALTDSEEGWVCVLGWDGEKVQEVAEMRLEAGGTGDEVVKAATAVWL